MEDKSIQGGLYRFQGNFLRYYLPILYIYWLDISGRTNTLSVPFRPTLIGGREGKGKGKGREGDISFSGGHLRLSQAGI